MLNRYILIPFLSLLLFSGVCTGQDDCFVITDGGGMLYRLTPGNCNKQFIGSCGINLLDIALTPSGDLYGIGFYELYRIDTADASVTYIANVAPPFTEIFNNLVALNDHSLMTLSSNFELLKIDVTDGSRTVLGTMVNTPSGDLTYYKDHYYLAGFPNILVKLTLNETLTALVSEEVVGTMSTGTSNVYGIITTGEICQEDAYKMYAFEGDNLYEVDPLDATTLLVCNNLYPGNAAGATSMNEAISPHLKQPAPPIPTIFTPNGDGINDRWYYAPAYISHPTLEIYNRWGQKVFSNNSNITWDGNAPDGSACSEGVYYFVLRYESYCGEQHLEKGSIHLLK